MDCRCRREGSKEEAYIWNKTGEGGKCIVCEQACRGSDKKNYVSQMIMWLANSCTLMLRTYYERLVFHAYSETNYPFRGCFQSFPTNNGFESS